MSTPETVNDVELLPLIVVPLTDNRSKLSNDQVGTAKVDVFTQEIYFDALSAIDNEFDIYNDGSDIITFGQQTFSTHDPTVAYVELPQRLIEFHGHHRLYTHTSGADVHVYVSETEDDGIPVSDDRFWGNFSKPNISLHIYQGVIDYSTTLGINELDIINQLPLKQRKTKPTPMDHEAMRPFFAYLPSSRIKKFFDMFPFYANAAVRLSSPPSSFF